jgi:dUTP pyrophosphatase
MTDNDLAYLAHPIDLYRLDDQRRQLVHAAYVGLQALGVPVYHPAEAFHVAGLPTDVISRVNKGAMDTSTGAVAFLPGVARSVGVPAEIEYMLNMGKPVAIVTDLHKDSWVLAGWAANPLCGVFGMNALADVEAAIGWLRSRMVTANAERAARDVEPIIFGKHVAGATLPTRGYKTDAGYDLYTCGNYVIGPNEFVDVSCGVSVDLPDGTWGLITGRSSTLRKRGLLVAQGVIDEEYTGELYAGCKNLTDQPVEVKEGERVAQLILHYAPGQEYTPTWGTPRTKTRGANGFGSTGL